MEVPQKEPETEPPCDPEIPLLSTYLRKVKTLVQKSTCTLVFIAAIFITANPWKQLKCPLTDECITYIIMRNTS